jgi:pyridoxamine 5'-phosphate oxidase
MLMQLEDLVGYSWTTLSRGADNPAHSMHLLTLATVSHDGKPSARLMVNRGAEARSAKLWFHSDLSSPKIAELKVNPWACVVGWDSGVSGGGVELRLSGLANLHHSDPLADRHWTQWSRQAMWMYEHGGAEAPPGAPDLRLPADRDELQHRLTSKARHQFVVIEIVVETIDWLQVVGPRQYRAVMHAAEGWRARWV